jgi:hypothetical protein
VHQHFSKEENKIANEKETLNSKGRVSVWVLSTCFFFSRSSTLVSVWFPAQFFQMYRPSIVHVPGQINQVICGAVGPLEEGGISHRHPHPVTTMSW